MPDQTNGWQVIREHGSGTIKIVELKNAKGYTKYRDEKVYFWSGEHRRTSLVNRGDYVELIFVLIQSGLVDRSELAPLLEGDTNSEGEGTTPVPFA